MSQDPPSPKFSVDIYLHHKFYRRGSTVPRNLSKDEVYLLTVKKRITGGLILN